MSQNLSNPLIDKALCLRISNCTTLPTPPAVAMKVIALGDDPLSGLKDVAGAVRMDPALSAKMLRVANSSMYARRHHAETLEAATTRLGFSGTITLALSFSMVNAMRQSGSEGLDMNRYWVRALTTAVASREIAKQVDASLSEQAFLAGLFADIGMLILDKVVPDLYRGVPGAEQSHALLLTIERNTLGVSHAAVGAWTLNKWNMPPSLVHAVSGSHGPQPTSSDNPLDNLANITALGSQIASLCTDDPSDATVTAASDRAETLFNLDREALIELIGRVSEQTQDTASMFDIDLSDAVLLESIAEQAKEILMVRNLSSIQLSEELQLAKEDLELRARSLQEETHRDGLTSTYNRSHFDEAAAAAHAESVACQSPLALAFVDLDHFKDVNDTHGHQAGDAVLQHAAGLISGLALPKFTVARYGGEEFVVIMPDTAENDAVAHCKRILRAFRDSVISLDTGKTLRVTASIGIAVQSADGFFHDAPTLIKASDMAMYAAKRQGRDRMAMLKGKTRLSPV